MRVLFLLLMFATFTIAQDDLSLGKTALEKKSYDIAIQHFQKYLTANSRNVEANYLLGETYRQKGDIKNAQSSLERALDFDDEYEPALASILRVYGKLGMWDKAAKRYKDAQKYHKGSTLSPIAYAQTYLELDSLDKASIYFSQAKELDPKNVEVYLGLSEVYSRQNVISLAVENLRTAVQLDSTSPSLHYRLALAILKNRSLNATQITEVMLHLQESIRLDPTNDNVIYDAAYTMFRTKVYWREAAEFFKKYLELKKDNLEAWEMYAVSLYNAKIYLEAIPAFEQAIKLKSKNIELKPMLAHSYYLAKEYQHSLDLYKTFIPDSLSVEEMYRMGFSYFQIKDTINAIKYLEQTVARETSNTDAIGTLAAIFLNKKDYEKASQMYIKLLQFEKSLSTASVLNSLYFAGYSNFVLGRNDSAKMYFLRLVSMRPNVIGYRTQLAKVYFDQDSIELSREQYKAVIQISDSTIKADPSKASQMKPNLVTAYYYFAIFSYKQDVKEAVGHLEKAISYETSKKDESIHHFLAQMYSIQSGDKEILASDAKLIRAKACEEYKVVMKINPKNQKAKKEFADLKCK